MMNPGRFNYFPNPKKAVIALLVIGSLSGCVLPYRQVAQKTFTPLPFDQAEYDRLPKTGTGVVRGRIVGRSANGDVKNGSGAVYLIPLTKYRRQWYYEAFVGNKLAAKPEDPRYYGYDRLRMADFDGRFEFKDVPPGPYYVVSIIEWKEESTDRKLRHRGVTNTKREKAGLEIMVQNDAVKEVLLYR